MILLTLRLESGMFSKEARQYHFRVIAKEP